MIGLAAGIVWAAIKRAVGAALARPWALLVAIGAAVIALLTYRARRAERRADRADRARDVAETTTAATVETLGRRADGDRTQREVIDAAREGATAHPDDPDAADRAAREWVRRRYQDGGGPHPVRDAAAPERPARRRKP